MLNGGDWSLGCDWRTGPLIGDCSVTVSDWWLTGRAMMVPPQFG